MFRRSGWKCAETGDREEIKHTNQNGLLVSCPDSMPLRFAEVQPVQSACVGGGGGE